MRWCRAVVRKRNQLEEKPGKEKRPTGRAGLGSLVQTGERKVRVGKERQVVESKEEPRSLVLLPGPSNWRLQNFPNPAPQSRRQSENAI